MLLYCIDSSENDSDIMSILSDEGTEDEGIGRSVRQNQGAIAVDYTEYQCYKHDIVIATQTKEGKETKLIRVYF